MEECVADAEGGDGDPRQALAFHIALHNASGIAQKGTKGTV
jgi:hypothetical protein